MSLDNEFSMTKAEALEHAERLGIPADGLSWQKLRHQVWLALQSPETMDNTEPEVVEKVEVPVNTDEIMELKRQLAAAKREAQAYKAKEKNLRITYENADDGRAPTNEELLNIPIEITPNIPTMNNPKTPKYMIDEELGYDVVYDENDYIKDGMPQLRQGEHATGTFRHRGYTKKKVMGTMGGPRCNPGQRLEPEELFITVYDDETNQSGYRWAEVKRHLKKLRGGYYLRKYRREIYGDRDESGSLSMIQGLYCIDKVTLNGILDDICSEEQKRIKESNNG